MAWGWFSSSAPPSAADASATTTTAPQNGNRPSTMSSEELQNAQRRLLNLEKETQDMRLRLQREEESRRGVVMPKGTRSVSTAATQAPQASPEPVSRTPQEEFRRSARQLGLFFAGATFLTASALISRRAVARRMVDAYPKFYQPSHHGPRAPPRNPAEKSEDTFVAVEALGLATLNVFSFGVMMTGGLMWAFDISNVEDLRYKARRKLYGANGVVDEAAEQQVEDWIADVLSRRDQKDDTDSPKKEGSG